MMDDVIGYLAIGFSVLSMVLSLYLFRQLSGLSGINQKSFVYKESSEFISNIIGELNKRLTSQDNKIADLLVKVDVLEGRIVRGNLNQVRPDFRDRYVVQKNNEDYSLPNVIPGTVKQHRMTNRSVESNFQRVDKIRIEEATKPNKIETRVLEKLSAGPMTAPEVMRYVGSSREHAARLMKALFEKGFVVRDDSKKPYTYNLTNNGRNVISI